MASPKTRTMVIGACGAVGRLLVRALTDEGQKILGVDKRRWRGPVPDGLELHRIGLTTRSLEDLFRRHQVTHVAHLGLTSSRRVSIEARYEQNVVGMQRVVSHCRRRGVRRLVVLSRGTVYGADKRNPVRLTEDAPLRGASRHSGLRPIVEADILALSLALRGSSLATAILRPAPVVGSHVHNTMTGYLRLPVVPTLIGYDPMVQLLHEDDLVRAIRLALATGADAAGVFNIPGSVEAPLSVVIRETGGKALPVLLPFFAPVIAPLWRRGLSPAPLPHVDHLRYQCMLDGRRASKLLDFEPRRTMRATFESVRHRRPDEALTDIFRKDRDTM